MEKTKELVNVAGQQHHVYVGPKGGRYTLRDSKFMPLRGGGKGGCTTFRWEVDAWVNNNMRIEPYDEKFNISRDNVMYVMKDYCSTAEKLCFYVFSHLQGSICKFHKTTLKNIKNAQNSYSNNNAMRVYNNNNVSNGNNNAIHLYNNTTVSNGNNNSDNGQVNNNSLAKKMQRQHSFKQWLKNGTCDLHHIETIYVKEDSDGGISISLNKPFKFCM